MKIWLLSPYHTGSHRAWALGYQRHSAHDVWLITMAGRFWKWRMQGGAIELANQAGRLLASDGPPDVVFATDMVNLPAWLGLMRTPRSGSLPSSGLPASVPIVLYMHENQLTYPARPGEKPDYTYAMINWLSQLSADRVIFNSQFHRSSWFEALPRLLKHFPDYNHLHLIQEVDERSICLPVGIDCSRIGAVCSAESEASASQASGYAQIGSIVADSLNVRAPLVLWNQRWEYDKQPERFFELLYRLHDDAGQKAVQSKAVQFEVAVAGENFRNIPGEFDEARRRLSDVIVHWGFVDDYDAYLDLLRRADLVVSTAIHEFFGISILEAIAAGAFPLLPQRLSYPELIPRSLHPACLYADEEDLFNKARMRLASPRSAPPSLRAYVQEQFDWKFVAAAYDEVLVGLVGGRE